MGWWSEKIMGGDAPLDALYRLARALAVPCDLGSTFTHWWRGYAFHLRPVAEWSEAAIGYALAAIDADPDYEGPIVAQVVALVLMRYGAAIPAEARERLALAIAADEWASEERRTGKTERQRSRSREIDGLIAALRAYVDGAAIDLDVDPGLLATIAEKRSSRA